MSTESALDDLGDVIRSQLDRTAKAVERIADNMPNERTLLAGLALAGMLADSEYTEGPSEAARVAVNYANALLRQLAQEPKEDA